MINFTHDIEFLTEPDNSTARSASSATMPIKLLHGLTRNCFNFAALAAFSQVLSPNPQAHLAFGPKRTANNEVGLSHFKRATAAAAPALHSALQAVDKCGKNIKLMPNRITRKINNSFILQIEKILNYNAFLQHCVDSLTFTDAATLRILSFLIS